MKAAVMENIGEIVVKEVPRPKAEPGGVLIGVKACAICGSDMRTIEHGSSSVKPPRILGHEVAGTIIEIGEGISGFRVGESVVVAPAIGCGECDYCRSGHTNMCPNLETLGFEFDGGFAEVMAVPAKAVRQGHVNKIPEGLSFEEATLAEPLACCINGQEPLSISIGQTVAVIGAGTIGLFHTELALLKGASRVFLVDVISERLKHASLLGKDVITVNSSEIDPVKEILSHTNGRGVEVVIVACPVGEAQNQALQMVARRGRISLFGGLPKDKSTGYLDSNLIHYKEVGVFGAHASTAIQNRLALSLLADRKLGSAIKYVTHILPLNQIEEGLTVIKKGEALKVVIKP
ncbi:MAG: hypothetical protein PWP04_1342 [Candidatus Atribacteria bacterium]|nr:hypothetical protein [Candidatus Atribacteria bacterium]